MSDSPFFAHLPPDMQEEVQRQADLFTMSVIEARHSIMKLVDELSSDQLKVLHLIVRRCGEEGSDYAKYLDGYISGQLRFKHDICPGCGETEASHDPQRLLDKEPKRTFEETVAVYYTPEQRKQMNLYGLDDVWDLETEEPRGFICSKTDASPYTGCGMPYTSIEDRMRDAPGIDGCSGCKLRSAHG